VLLWCLQLDPQAAKLAASWKKCGLAAGKFAACCQPSRKKIGLSHHPKSDNPQLFFNHNHTATATDGRVNNDHAFTLPAEYLKIGKPQPARRTS
jgi:hypothetical protein